MAQRAPHAKRARMWAKAHHYHFSSWEQHREQVTSDLSLHLDQVAQRRLHMWRRRMKTDSAAYKWLRGSTFIPVEPIVLKNDEYVHGNDAVRAVQQHYKAHFHHPIRKPTTAYIDAFRPELDEMRADTAAHRNSCTKPVVETTHTTYEPTMPSPGAFRRHLSKCCNKATGTDGWSASELMALPDSALDELIGILGHSERTARWPRQLLRWRQIHIPKDAGTARLDRLRPIAIASVVLRAWQRHRCEGLEDLLKAATSPHQAGGVRRRSLEKVLEPILTSMECSYQRRELQANIEGDHHYPPDQLHSIHNFLRNYYLTTNNHHNQATTTTRTTRKGPLVGDGISLPPLTTPRLTWPATSSSTWASTPSL